MPDRTPVNNISNAAAAMQELLDAGDSVPKLIEAVKNASFLENVPSPERQVLRASKIKLKKAIMKETSERRKSLFQNSDKVDVDKIVNDAGQFEKLCDEYEKMKWRIIKMPGGATRKADSYYTLYGLMKQALQGDVSEDCPMFAENGNIDFHGRFLWDAWNLAKGLTNKEAKKKFVTEFFHFPTTSLYSDKRSQLIPAL